MCLNTIAGICLSLIVPVDEMMPLNKDVRENSIQKAVNLDSRPWQVSFDGDERIIKASSMKRFRRTANREPHLIMNIGSDYSDRHIVFEVFGERKFTRTNDEGRCVSMVTVEGQATGYDSESMISTHTISSSATAQTDYRMKDGACTLSDRTHNNLRDDAYSQLASNLMDDGGVLEWYNPFGYIVQLYGAQQGDTKQIVAKVDAGSNFGFEVGQRVQFYAGVDVANPYHDGYVVDVRNSEAYVALSSPEALDLVLLGDIAYVTGIPLGETRKKDPQE